MRNPEDADTTDRAGRGPICRHLGTEDDRSSYYSEPSRRHRCYLWWQRDRIDLAHQARFCFTEAHSVCPWLSISPPLSVEREGRILPLRPEAHDIAAPPSHRVFVIVIALWLWLRVAMGILGRRAAALAVAGWRWLRPVIARVARSLWARLKGGLLGLGHQLAEVLRQRRHSEPATLAEPAGTPIEAPQPLLEPAPASPAVVLVSHPQGILSPLRRLVKPPVITWRCSACEAINSGPSQVCHKCGRPSPEVEEQLMSSGDELLAKGLAGLKDKNEELAYACFVMACEASPDSELAWYWRAKTAPTLDEVIRCLERLLELTPGNAKVQADLNWALQRRQHEQARPVAVAAAPQPARPALRPKIGARYSGGRSRRPASAPSRWRSRS
jgi:hypothetical protein